MGTKLPQKATIGFDRVQVTVFASNVDCPIDRDDLQYADMLTRYFRYLGYEVRIAGNPRDALSLFEREEFDLVLLDHHLPQMTGLEVAQKLREQNQRIRMILLSGELHDGQHELFREVGFYSVLTKTSSLKEVGQTVRESLDAPPPSPRVTLMA